MYSTKFGENSFKCIGPQGKEQVEWLVICDTFASFDKRKHSEIEMECVQGVQGQTFMFQFALTDRNMEVRFGLKVVWDS